MCSDSDLLENEVEVEIMWIPGHMQLEGNKIVDERARHAALNGTVFERFGKICFAERVQILVDSLTPYSQRFLFDLGLRVKRRTRNLFPLC
jgi:hypothetical protein